MGIPLIFVKGLLDILNQPDKIGNTEDCAENDATEELSCINLRSPDQGLNCELRAEEELISPQCTNEAEADHRNGKSFQRFHFYFPFFFIIRNAPQLEKSH